MMLSFILILTKTAVTIIKVNKKDATESIMGLMMPTSRPIGNIEIKNILIFEAVKNTYLFIEIKTNLL